MEESVNSMNESAIAEISFATYLRSAFQLEEVDIKTYSPLTLAYIGDSIYDVIIRTLLVEKGNAPVQKLHKRASSLVKASAQVAMFHAIKDELTEQEMGYYKRGRNAKSFTSAKNATITDYRTATGIEALVGYLYLTDQMPRIIGLMKLGLSLMEEVK
ncbi:ribonuclease-3 family protein [Anaerosporobacter mobilis DSM 15930]|jgi:ribonuclease-3 family protein|uniref:Mini-ribonuclease 3 n=1 Tax=Anaerosporobacter mobilis DSM 15930 TaxID=1120996 RepID=A0A1M7JHE0_9FIRM|nr:ribonuclease III domain-containing protein [Anaerosporobacter mobilis]SHM52434.1 ribonuclease-3 family protein [Anaerosporobacter mobilis DSM 15930]